MLINLITAASVLLAKFWKDESIPSLLEWKIKVYQIYLMYDLSAYCHGLSGSFGAIDKFKPCWHQYIERVFPDMIRW